MAAPPRGRVSGAPRLHSPPGSAAAPLAQGLAWLWRLGGVRDDPAADAVGVGTAEEATELAARVREGRLAGAVVLAGADAGPADGLLPARRAVAGVARLADGVKVDARFATFASGRAAVETSAGPLGVRDGRLLVLGVGPEAWGRLEACAWLPAIGELLAEALARPLVTLPPVGCLRLDDLPGTAQHQVEGRAHPDARQRRRVGQIVSALRGGDAVLTVAVAARALADGQPVPLDEVWPDSVEAIAAGVREGRLEPACHGTLHLDTDAHAEGRVEPREFARLDEATAGARLDEALAWLTSRLGPAPTFIAPAWGYSPGTLAAAAARDLPTWLPPEPGPLLSGHGFRETLRDGLPGLHRLDYRPLARLASAGLPPTVVFHGGLLDHRMDDLRPPRDLWPLARLALRRDLFRIPRIPGVRWVGGGELVQRLRAHDAIEVDGDRPRLPEGERAVLVDASGRREATG